MKTLFLLAFVAVALAEEACFVNEGSKDEWVPLTEACKKEFPESKEDRIKSIIGCMYKKKGILSEDGLVLDIGKYKAAFESSKARDIKHVIDEMDNCWKNSKQVVAEFFGCFGPELVKLCPDVKQWTEDL